MAEAALAAKAVGWAVSPLITKLSDTYLGGDVSAEKLHELKTITLPKIEMVIEAAETNPNAMGRWLAPWLNDLRAAALEAEDVLDEHDYELLEEKVSPPSLAWALCVSEICKKIASMAKGFLSPVLPKTELAKSVEKLEKIAARVDEFMKLLEFKTNPSLAGSSSTSAIAKTQEVVTTTSNPPLAVFGRDKECDSIVNLLITSAGDAAGSSGGISKVPIIAIYGIGGAGKTTLAQKIYHDSKVVHCFPDGRMWVHVPRKFDTSRVAKEMMESLTGEATGDMLNLNALLEKLKANLKDQKFLLVLDDVWDEPKDGIQYGWDQLVGALNAVAVRGSRVLMTTRSEGVASMLGAKDRIPLEELASQDCLSIIEHYAFKDGLKFADFPGELREVGIQIVNRLKGSPLAARMVASNQLRQNSTVDAWRSISEGDLLKKTTVRDVLLSSFKHLPVHLQRCFAFCSLFPEGNYMYQYELINLWIAEGFVDAQEKNGSRAEDIGSRYCDELEYHSFFQRPPDSSESDICYVIHDLLHDLAGDVSNGICYRIEGDDKPREIPLTVVHLSITNAKLGIHRPNICKLVSLRTLILMDDSETEFADFVEVFEKLKRLRVLDLDYARGFSELPSSVGHLKHLRYLHLVYTGIKRLPPSFSRLYHLQFLNLVESSIESLPEGMNNLISLRHLIADRDLVCSIPEIGKLTSLQTLEEYRIGKDKQHGIGQLKTMRELRGSLRIKNLENVRDRAQASEAMLKEKKHLNELTLEWADSDDRDGKSDEEVLEALEPYPPTLKKLKICGYKGVRTPSWMSESQCLSDLESLELYDCIDWELGAIEPPSHLKKLRIIGNRGLEYPRWMSESQYLCHLEELYLSDCSKWEVLPPLGQLPMLRVLAIKNATGVRQIGPEFYGTDGGNSGGFPRLEELNLSGMEICEQWTGGSAAAFPSLPYLDIYGWPELRHVSGLPHHVKCIRIRTCPKLRHVSGLEVLERLSSLKQLWIWNCPMIETLPNHLPATLETLYVHGCHPELKRQYGAGGPQRHEIQHISHIYIYE